MNRSYALHLMTDLLAGIRRIRLDKNPIKTEFTPLGTNCVVEYRGFLYRISVERLVQEKPTEEMSCVG